MSTYLVAIVVSDFECVSETLPLELSERVNVRVCAKPRSLPLVEYAFGASKDILAFFERLHNVSYPLPKIGQTHNSAYLL